jgi:hypothetical protein
VIAGNKSPIETRDAMKIIEVRPSEKFKDAWVAFEAPGERSGEVHIYDDDGCRRLRDWSSVSRNHRGIGLREIALNDFVFLCSLGGR